MNEMPENVLKFLKKMAHEVGKNEADTFYSDEDDIVIIPQKTIGKYRCDFEIIYHYPSKETIKSVIIECDSQEWHERTEIERRYEKQRDRYLVSKNYNTLHFTGKEIIANPMKVASEIIEYLMPHYKGSLQLDSNIKD